jgi:hypothetical protein
MRRRRHTNSPSGSIGADATGTRVSLCAPKPYQSLFEGTWCRALHPSSRPPVKTSNVQWLMLFIVDALLVWW